MRDITKGPEPKSLTEHRAGEHCDYDNYQGKDELRQALVREQRGLCCYCMGRIRADTASIKIEHWRCQARFPADQLNYQNLLGSCLGGQSQPSNKQHCDSRKGDRDLRWNPADPAHLVEVQLRYEIDGTIRAADDELNQQLDEVLNLNLPRLKNNRKGILTAVLQWWKGKKPVPKEQIQREIQRHAGGDNELQPYCGVAVWWLKKKLTRRVR